MSSPLKPKIRAIEPFLISEQDDRQIGIRDPNGFVDHAIVLSREILAILPLMDGTRTIEQIRKDFENRCQVQIGAEVLLQIVETLDEALFLDNEAFAAHFETQAKAFRELGVRPAQFAGEDQAYPDDREQLLAYFRAMFTSALGPGEPDRSVRNGRVRGAVIPHIDFNRGGHSYAHVYRRLAESEPADAYVVLGTNHHGFGEVYTVTRNAFDTPLGRVEADGPLMDSLIEACGERVLKEELSHRDEHSVEFQAVFLKYLHDELYGEGGEGPPFTIVPVVCGGFHALVEAGMRPEDEPAIKRFLDWLRGRVRDGDRRVCVLASADLAHVGAKFGHEDPITSRLLRKLERCDRDMLRCVAENDAGGFFTCIAGEENRRNVCGFASIYTLLACADAERVELLHYEQAVEGTREQPHSVVTFAGIVLH